MIQFGNYQYLAYIATVSAVTLLAYLLFLLWKRRAVAMLARGVGGRSLVRGSRAAAAVKHVLTVLCIIMFAVTALRPRWGEITREAHNEGSDVLIALDVSPSMLARDVGSSRLSRAKDAVRWIVESLHGDRVGLILFSGDAFLQCPLTNDYGAFMMFLDAASPDSIRLRGTDIGGALREAHRVFTEKRLTSRILVLITDGEDHEGTAEEAARLFNEMDVAVYTVGVGSSGGEVIPLEGEEEGGGGYQRDREGKMVRTARDASFLKRIAARTRGSYIDISEGFSGLRFILEIIGDQEKNRYGSRIVREPRERYQVFALILLLLLALEVMMPERGSVPAPGRTHVGGDMMVDNSRPRWRLARKK